MLWRQVGDVGLDAEEVGVIEGVLHLPVKHADDGRDGTILDTPAIRKLNEVEDRKMGITEAVWKNQTDNGNVILLQQYESIRRNPLLSDEQVQKDILASSFEITS